MMLPTSQREYEAGLGILQARSASGKTGDDGSIRGLGSLLANLTSAVGIKPCGECKRRAEKMDKAVPFRWGWD